MLVGLLADLGVTPSTFEWELNQLRIEDHHLHFERCSKSGISAVRFSVHEGAVHGAMEKRHSHPSTHASEEGLGPEENRGRDYGGIRNLILESDLSKFVKERAVAIFHRLAVAEAKIHGVPVDQVHFHEVGALDSIIDIVLSCVGLEALKIDQVFVSALVDGRGTLQSSHGRYPVPAPATLEILRGLPLGQVAVDAELITPTGAAFVAEFQRSIGLMPPLRIEKIGYGAGTRDLPDRPNVLRGVLGEIVENTNEDSVVEIQANIDDLSPEILGATQEQLLQSGALEVFFTPAQMKKNRPGTLLTVLCSEAKLPEMQALILRETSTFGVRYRNVRRKVLSRQSITVETDFGPIRVKVGMLGKEILQVSPEFEDCRAVALKKSKPLKRIYEAAIGAFWRAQESGSETPAVRQ
jgi:pyridinium-3,5-bisthiocarboxylic acid mononucleotide nickel chelatase